MMFKKIGLFGLKTWQQKMNLKIKVKSSEIDSCVQFNKKSGSKNLKQHLFVYQTVSVDIAALSGQSTNERENMKQSSDFFCWWSET